MGCCAVEAIARETAGIRLLRGPCGVLSSECNVWRTVSPTLCGHRNGLKPEF